MHLEPAKQVSIVLKQNKLAHSAPAFKKLCGHSYRLFRFIGLGGTILLENKQVYNRPQKG